MFHKTRILLTAYYLLIIMVISISFSITISNLLTNELHRGFQRLIIRYSHVQPSFESVTIPNLLEPGYLEAAEYRIRLSLLYINIFILGISSVAGYILAGITLRPIKTMLDEQNRFITDASHELRTPLTALRTSMEVYLRGKSHTFSEANDLIGSNLEEVQSLQLLADNLLTLTQFEQNSLTTTPHEIVSLTKVIEESCKKIEPLAHQKKIHIECNQVKEGFLKGDFLTFVQLFLIFLDNAVKYSSSNTTIEIASTTHDGNISIAITDHGKGIAKEQLVHIFDRFYRADTSRSKNTENGYGLGLAIAHRIIKFYAGSIEVTSELSRGTTFTLTFPRFKGRKPSVSSQGNEGK